MKAILEVVCTSIEDCQLAEDAGADRIELVSAIDLGGITPSCGLIEEVLKATRLPVLIMIRPRSGGFVYSPEEVSVMKSDLKRIKELGPAGIVFGALTKYGDIDREALAFLLQEVGDMQTVCHRCFDSARDPIGALEDLISLGFDRVLTSGQNATAVAGAARIQELIDHAAGRIEILPGGGVRAHNAVEILKQSGASQIHAGPFVDARDQTPVGSKVDYGTFKRLDLSEVRAIVDAILNAERAGP